MALARYHNKRFADAIAVWSGGNYVQSYIDFVKKRAPGMTENTIMSDALLNSPLGIAFLKAQAWHEAGKEYPASDDDWLEAQRCVFGGQKPPAVILPNPKPLDVPPIVPASPQAAKGFWATLASIFIRKA
ncbi:hypothetical protein [Bradyrhizobium lablabi]|uniref:Uncharacterized protein n=1 Tax=Bradyrhizobium lablabi TaxID=722472 RepID=A0A1H5JL79_9BRAD|nr:hypothetical protein [Bradyrhizobium lablabi]SEE53323.1 hypothetical protein SAMN05444171_7890 [Bradyrhizobium lablabi]